jgi:hypothetical protein
MPLAAIMADHPDACLLVGEIAHRVKAFCPMAEGGPTAANLETRIAVLHFNPETQRSLNGTA